MPELKGALSLPPLRGSLDQPQCAADDEQQPSNQNLFNIARFIFIATRKVRDVINRLNQAKVNIETFLYYNETFQYFPIQV